MANTSKLDALTANITTLEGSVSKLERDLASVQGDVAGLGLPSNVKVVKAVNSKPGAEEVALNISGKGRLYACGVYDRSDYGPSLRLNIDGVDKTLMSNRTGGFVSKSCLLDFTSQGSSGPVRTVFGAKFECSGVYFNETSNLPNDFSGDCYVSLAPIPFNSLRVTINNVVYASYAIIAYTLDQ